MASKRFQLLAPVSKAVTFSSDAVNTTDDASVSIQVITTSASTLNVSLQLEVSNDGTNWDEEGSPIAVTTNTTTSFKSAPAAFAYARVTSTRTGGTATFEMQGCIKG
jgi:hypothetical protein